MLVPPLGCPVAWPASTARQVAALKEGQIDIGFGRVPFEDPAVDRLLVEQERLLVALPTSHSLVRATGPLQLAMLAAERLIVYPRAPRPSYADQVLQLFHDQGLRPAAVREVRELQTALGLVGAEDGVCVVPAALQNLRRDNVTYRPLADAQAFSPIIMSVRKADPSPELSLMVRLVATIYAENGNRPARPDTVSAGRSGGAGSRGSPR